MQFLSRRLDYLFRSTRGLTLVAIAVVSIITAMFGTLSGPMVEWGVKDITVRALDIDLVETEREGRIIMLYHTIAMTIVAIEVYFMTEILPMKRHEQAVLSFSTTSPDAWKHQTHQQISLWHQTGSPQTVVNIGERICLGLGNDL
jgi:hypothetical protein